MKFSCATLGYGPDWIIQNILRWRGSSRINQAPCPLDTCVWLTTIEISKQTNNGGRLHKRREGEKAVIIIMSNNFHQTSLPKSLFFIPPSESCSKNGNQ